MGNKRGTAERMPVHGNSKYPWHLWANGKTHKVVRGMDFETSTETFRRTLGSHACAHNLKVTTRVRGDAVWFQFSAKECG